MKNVEDIYPLSPLQQGILYHTLHEREFSMYFEIITWVIEGEVNVEAYERAWQSAVDLHPVLRSSFVWEGVDEPLQVVRRRAKLPMTHLDWRGLGSAEQETRLASLFTEERRRGFDLMKAPLMRVTLIRTGDAAYRFIWCYHHGLVDGWSCSLIFNDVFFAYEALCRGAVPRPAAPRLFAEYIDWVRHQDMGAAESYWQRTLKGFTAPTPLGIGGGAVPRAVAEADSKSYREQGLCLPAEVTGVLTRLARRHQLTLNTLCLGAWAVLLSRYSGEEDVIFGVAVSGRPPMLTGVETMVGMLVNTLPMRVRVEPERELLPWLEELQRAQVELRQYEYSPLVRVHGWSEVPRNTPLFETVLSFENHPVDYSLLKRNEGASLRDVVHHHTATGIPVNLTIEPGEELLVKIFYDFGRIDDDEVGRMLSHLARLLESVAADPDRRLSELNMLTEAERNQLLDEWNRTAADYPHGRMLHTFVERQAARTPEAVALICGPERLTYAQLDERADRLAARLRALGVGPEALVGVMLERSPELVVALLGVLRAGGAYLPLDPAYPAERLGFILEDAQAGVLLTQRHLRERLPASGAHVMCLEAGSVDEDAVESAIPTGAEVSWENLAYVIYTSGSTGRPKGVAITHRSAAALVHWAVEYFAPEELAGVLFSTSVCFDLSIFELFVPLSCGGKVILAEHALALPALDAAAEVTLINTVPSAMSELVRSGDVPASVRTVNLAGEPLKNSLVQNVYAQETVRRVVNLYGPTEDTTYSTVAAAARGAQTEPTIGRPIANTRAYVLDRRMRLVPVGVVGELYLGGEGLARGYLRRPALTAERFVPDPYGAGSGARLYRTGDLARYLPGGQLEYLGRMDHQVKVRGFRIEPGEVEAALVAHHLVREAVVVVREEVAGEKRLVAYLACDEPGAASQTDWRAHLRQQLPDYMIPGAFVCLRQMPLTPNGKLDRRALPAPEPVAGEREGGYVAPRTPVEEIVADIYASVLGLERVGVNANFFDLGGHSLLAAQVISRVRQTFKVELSLRKLFLNTTAEALAQNVEEALRDDEGAAVLRIERAPRDADLPLSFSQQRLWFIDQLEPGTPIYNITAAVSLEGRLDLDALKSALGEIVRRHEILRTTFDSVGGRPVQRVHAELPPSLTVEDLGESQERDEAVQRLTREEAAHPFDLSRGPLLRVRLLRLGEVEHVALLTMHHIVSDGWSMGLLVRELSEFYGAFVAGRPSPLGELALQYADYAVWQRDWLQGEVLETQVAYWRRQLAGAPSLVELPFDFPRPFVQTYRGAVEHYVAGAGLVERLRALGRAEGATLFMTLLAAFKVLLARHSGQTDLVVGTDIANRQRAETEDLIGFFVNMLLLRTDLSDNPTFAELLGRTRETALEAYAHQDLPFEKLVEELQPGRDAGHSPLFNVVFVLQNTPMGALTLPGLTIRPHRFTSDFTRYDVEFHLWERDGGLDGFVVYNRDLFAPGTVRNLLAHYSALLEAVCADPDGRVVALPLMAPGERHKLLVEWNETAAEYPDADSLSAQFEKQVARTPGADAVVFGERHLTYDELNRRANRLARRLRALGVGPEVPVAICVERSVEMVVGLLGILKAGGFYVPLDPGNTIKRQAFMLEETAPPVIVAQEHLLDELPSHWGQIVLLDSEWDDLAAEGEGNLAVGIEADNLAYVLYTSGSTGEPKGVQATHRAVMRLVKGSTFARMDAGETFLQMAPLSFDASTFEIWGALLNGARLVVMPPENPTLEELGAALGRHGVTTLWLTAGLFHLMLDENPGALRGLRQLLAGGDALSPSHVARAARELKGCRLVNGYGPTESTTFACCYTIPPGEFRRARTPIGRPIENTYVYVLDEALEPAPAGVVGELYIGGAGLARGYQHRPALTAERFIPDPFSKEPGARLYKTGDLVRLLPEGELEFLGRSDFQVKLRGFRIEPGEVEAALVAHHLVREAVVVVREEVAGEKRLVAYLACDEPGAASQTDWRAHLRQQLPDYMIPGAFVCLRQMPLTPNGKLDRRALPAPEFQRDEAAHARLAPRTPVEAALFDIWRDLLHVARPGLDDNFFDLGGHSLLATQVLSRLRDLFGVEVPLRALFEEPTLAGLAVHVESNLAGGVRRATPPLEPAARDAALPLSFAQQRLWFMDQLEPGNPRYNLTHAFRLRGRLDMAALERSVEEIVRRHEILRTTFAVAGRVPAQVIHPDATVKPDFRDLGHLPAAEREAEARRIADAQAIHRFDLVAGPLLRISLLRLGAEEHVFVLTMHHIISDGWSMGVWVGEVTALYNAYCRGLPASLPALPIQYADFAKWQHELVESGALDEELAYWKELLAGDLPPVELPFDYERPARPTFGGATFDFEFPAALYDALRELSRREGTTLYMALLAGFEALLYRYTGRVDVAVGAAIANRNHPGVEGLIGFFVNVLVMRTDLSGDPGFRELLGRVRETALGAYAHQDAPFDVLVNALRVERQGAVNPLFQTLFILQNAPLEAFELEGLTLTNFEVTHPVAHLDLIFSLQEREGTLAGVIQYSTELFEEETVALMLSRYRELLEEVTADPEKRLSELGVSAGPSDDAFTLRDLPEVKLSREQLASLLQEFNEP